MDIERRLLEESLRIEEEWLKRQEVDPLKQFQPHPKQQPFVEAILEGKTRQAWFLGANRCGKSDIGSYVGAHLARYGPPDPPSLPFPGAQIELKDRATSGWVVSLDFPNSRDVIQPKYFDNGFTSPAAHEPFIPQREIVRWKPADNVLKLKNGSIIGFKSCDSPATKLQGSGRDWIHFDEAPPKEHFDEATIRVEAGRKLIIFGTCTLLPPIGTPGGVSWVYSEIVKPVERGQRPDVMIFTSGIYDNPHIGQEEIKLLEILYPEGSASRRIRLDGDLVPGVGGARAYPAYDPFIHAKSVEIDRNRPLCWIWDFNIEPLITHVGQRVGARFHVCDQIVIEDGGSIDEMAELFYGKYQDHPHMIWIYGDATARGRNPQTGKNDYTLICNALRHFGIPYKLKVPEQNPYVTDRLNAMSRAMKQEDGESMLVVDPKCVELLEDFDSVLLDHKGGIKKSHNRNDPYYRRTHASDGIGYWIAYEAPVKFKRYEMYKSTLRRIKYAFGAQAV